MVKGEGGGVSLYLTLFCSSLSLFSSLGAWSSVMLGGGDWPLLVDPWGMACAGWLHGG